MTWQSTLYKRVAHELERQGVEAWLLHLDRLAFRRIEAAPDGNSLHHGESTCLSLALWWGERVASLSFLIMPDRIQDISERLAAAIESLSIKSSNGCHAQLAPRWQEGVWNGWEGDWNSLAHRWRPQLVKSISGKGIAGIGGIGTQQLTLSLECRELLLRDHIGRTRKVTRHAARVVIFCRGGPKGRGTWTMTVPFATPEPRDLAPHIKRAMRHARLRACHNSFKSGTGPIFLQPTAVAQILATVKSSGESDGRASAEFLPAGVLHPPRAYRDDLGFSIDSRAIDANKGTMRFAHQAALPSPGLDQIWIRTGKATSQRAGAGGLTIWHLDEVLTSSLPKRFVMIVSGQVKTSTGSRDASRLRLDIPWRAVQEALLDPESRGRSALAIHFGETDYYLPALSLGEFSWEPL